MIRQIAQRIRHLPGLEKAEGLWRIVRRPYQKVLNIGGRGVLVRVGGKAQVRMPAEFAGGSWDEHEPETVEIFVRWLQDHPNGLVLDVGSSIGIFSAIALFANPTMEVIAFDPDLSSLAAARRMCQHASGSRLRLVYGFLADQGSQRSLDDAVAQTVDALARTGLRGDVGTTQYLGLNDQRNAAIPTYALDDLLADEISSERPLLIKCDVEGAELRVLRGAEKLIQRVHPDIVLSVHPPVLSEYGCAKNDIENFLQGLGYKVEVIGVDHEEHWWCEFDNASQT